MSRRPPLFPGLFIATALVLVTVLAWMTWRLINQDHALVERRLQQNLENAAEELVATMKADLARVEQRLAELARVQDSSITHQAGSYSKTLGEGVAIAIAEARSIEVHPADVLLYYPILPPRAEADSVLFEDAEKFEFRRDYESAVAQYRHLAQGDAAIQAAALIRLARVFRKQGKLHDALDVYAEVAGLPAHVDGLPAGLLACYGRCLVLDELQQTVELDRAARTLRSDLCRGRWKVTGADYRFYERETLHWLQPANISHEPDGAVEQVRLPLTAGTERLWSQWQQVQRGEAAKQGCEVRWVNDVPLLLMWHAAEERKVGLVATSAWLERQWLAALRSPLPPSSFRICLTDYQGRAVVGRPATPDEPKTVRTSAQTSLPYTLEVAFADSLTVVGEAAGRQRLLLAGLGMTVLIVLVASYFVVRSVMLELKVARLQSGFVSAVSHEFRTPLASICQLSELLVDGRVSNEERRAEYYQALQRESQRLQRLVEGLLDFGRMEAGAREYDFKELDPVGFVQELGTEFEAEVRDRGYGVQIEAADSVPTIIADREALRLAVWNLLDNAVKYSPGCGTVVLGTGCDQGRVFFRVQDHGIGISQRDQREIFKKFFRSPQALVNGVKGTGLGLAIVKNIVAAHGGTVKVDSRPQQGSTFTISIQAHHA